MTTVNYAMSYPYVANPPGYTVHLVQRAWLEIEVWNGGTSRRLWSLVDTGTDDLLLDSGIALLLGIHLGPANASVATAAGPAQLHRVQNLNVDLAGTTITTDVLFGALPMPLLGRGPLLAAVEAGFGHQRWYHT